MVRSWHWEVVPLLDDERLTAQHSESHMMMNALLRVRLTRPEVRVGWVTHPETLTWARHPEHLAWLHDFTVQEMAARGYASGSDHQTPMPVKPVEVNDENYDTPLAAIGYKATTQDWLERDYADLYFKWDSEGRWDEDGYALLGRRISCKTFVDSGERERCWICRPKYKRHIPTPPTTWSLPQEDKYRTHRDFLKPFHDKVGPRDQIGYDSAGMKLIAAKYRVDTFQVAPLGLLAWPPVAREKAAGEPPQPAPEDSEDAARGGGVLA